MIDKKIEDDIDINMFFLHWSRAMIKMKHLVTYAESCYGGHNLQGALFKRMVSNWALLLCCEGLGSHVCSQC